MSDASGVGGFWVNLMAYEVAGATVEDTVSVGIEDREVFIDRRVFPRGYIDKITVTIDFTAAART